MNIETVLSNANADSMTVGLYSALIAAVIMREGGRIQFVNMTEAIIYYASNEFLVSIKQESGSKFWVNGWI